MQTVGNLLSRPLPDRDDSQVYSTGLPSAWLEHAEVIFGQLAIHYGAARMAAHWNGVDPDKAKVYWAKRLMKLSRRSLGYALSHLPQNPPTVDEFCAIANRCPPPEVKMLGYTPTKEEKAARLEELKKFRKEIGI